MLPGTMPPMRRFLFILLLALPAGADEIADRIRDLGSEDYAVREEALKKLVGFGQAAVPALREAMQSEDPEVQSKAAAALHLIAWEGALPKSFREKYPETPGAIVSADEPNRVAWAQRISRECGKDAVRPSLLLLQDASPLVRAAALMALCNGAETLSEHRDAELLAGLEPALLGDDLKVRVLAVKAAGAWARKTGVDDEFARESRRRLVPLLIEALGAEGEDIRSSAAQALGRIGDPAAVPALTAVSEDAKAQVRIMVVGALAEIGDPRGVEAVARRLADGNPDAVRAALDACRRLRAAKAAPEVRDILRREDAAATVKQAALEVLAEIAPPATEEARALRGAPETDLRSAAWRVLLAADLADAAVAVRDEDAEVRLVAALALARGKKEEAVPLLMELLDDGRSTTVRDAYRKDIARGEVRVVAMESLAALTGRKEPASDPEAAAAGWRAWWAAEPK